MLLNDEISFKVAINWEIYDLRFTIYDLRHRHPECAHQRAYWSISWMTYGVLTRVIKLVTLRAATLRTFVIALSVTWRRLEG